MKNRRLLVVGVVLVLAALALGLAGNTAAWGPFNNQPYGNVPRRPGFGGMMGGGPGFGGMMGGGMMGTGPWANQSGSVAIDLDQAEQSAQEYVAARGNPDLAFDEIMEFSNNYYVVVKEKSTGIGAFELLVNKGNGAVFPEYGPNMMWNLKYSPMAGMMGGGMMGQSGRGRSPQAGTGAEMSVSPDQAQANAQKYLDQYFPGATVDEPSRFYGYYTLDFQSNEQTVGMLSVNGYTGQVWYHNWHGDFIQEKELD